MLKVYEAEQVSDAEQVRDLLEERGIAAFVFGEHTYNAPGVNPLAWPAVWIAEDHDYERAKALIRDFEDTRQKLASLWQRNAPRWRYRKCGEWNEATFALCWNCGAEAPENWRSPV